MCCCSALPTGCAPLRDEVTLSSAAAPETAADEKPPCYRRPGFYWAAILPTVLALAALPWLFGIDRGQLMGEVQALTTRLPDSFWAGLTLLGNGSMLFALFALAWRHRPEWLIAGICALPASTLYARGLKHLVVSPRPAAILPPEQLHVIGERLAAHSFPSGHTTTAFVAAGIIVLSGRAPRPLALLAVVGAALVGMSRIAVGAHWPTDVLAGAAGGWLAGGIGIAIAQAWPWVRSRRAEQVVGLIVLVSSASLFVVDIGYLIATPFKYLIATVGTLASLHWLKARIAS